jgi:hypothetical protein
MIVAMRIISFTLVEHLAIEVRFADGAALEVRFESDQLRGWATALISVEEFSTARVHAGTVQWRCGYALDAQLARIRADEGRVWTPTAR